MTEEDHQQQEQARYDGNDVWRRISREYERNRGRRRRYWQLLYLDPCAAINITAGLSLMHRDMT